MVPTWLVHKYRRARFGHTWIDYEDQSPRDVFTHIYTAGIWGKGDGTFYSGPGSDLVASGAYIDAVKQFIKGRQIRSIVDLGCGDFRVGANIVTPDISYHGVDVVQPLIAHNQSTYGAPNITFSCRDAIREPLPDAELCLIREVFQHLSNRQIAAILTRCRGFRYVIVTEKVASPDRFTVANADSTHGPNMRADLGSGVMLDRPPFAERIAAVLLDLPQPDRTILRSVLIEHSA